VGVTRRLPEGRLIRVTFPARGVVAGLIVHGGVVVYTAPYLWWCIGVEEHNAARRLRASGAVLEPMDPR
jgi:hypothetical protein